ncbi:MAG TPA: DUF58 domain-containing protein [Thermomicrobiales bacterium]|nr:DUF58 domain-containing protein [Thermomicrobiales bacterium]
MSQDGPTSSEAHVNTARSLFFNTAWLWCAGGMILIGMITRERAPSLLGLLTLVTAGASWLWARYSLKGVTISRSLSTDRVFPGEQVAMRVTVINRKLLPLAWLDIEDRIPERLRIVEQEVVPSGVPGMDVLRITTAARWYERVSWRFHVTCTARGYYTFGPTILRSGDLFGFFTSREQLAQYSSVMVFPTVVPLEEISIPPRHLFGDLRARRQMITDPSRTVGVRDYHPEDSIRHVHWNATARAQRLQTKVFEPTTTVQFGVFLNLDTFEHYWEGIDYAKAEAAITVAASLAMRALTERHAVGMYANGVVGGSDQPLRIRPSRGPEQGGVILAGLAKLSPVASLNYPRLLRSETSRFPWGSTIVIVTPLMSDPLAVIMADLARSGHRVVLIGIDDVETPPIRGLLVYAVAADRVRPSHDRWARRSRHSRTGAGLGEPVALTDSLEEARA